MSKRSVYYRSCDICQREVEARETIYWYTLSFLFQGPKDRPDWSDVCPDCAKALQEEIADLKGRDR